MTSFEVAIVAHDTEMTVHRIKVNGGRRDAERVERGANINLDHAHYYTEIRERSEKKS